MIEIRNLRFCYPDSDFALTIPDLTIPQGETVAVVGPSGTGKTTLLNLIAGTVLPQAGQVITQGREVSGLADGARRELRIAEIGLVFQEFELLEYLNVIDNILLPFRITPTLRLTKGVRDRAEALARRVGISDKLGRYVSCLSQGERQRVAVVRALLTEPSLLLADEPTGNLDPQNKERVLDILLQYAAQHGATLVTITHDHDILDRFQRVIDFREFPGAPQSPQVSDLMGSAR